MGWGRRVGAFARSPLDEAWAGLCGCDVFRLCNRGYRGGIALQGGSTRRRHAAGRLRVVQNPRWIDSSHVVSPQARGERRADLRNKLIGVVQIVPSDADNVPALGLEVALAFALAGK